MDVKLRSGTPEDAQTCGRICYEAFRTVAGEHNFRLYVVKLGGERATRVVKLR
jgi:hypothetical protein